MIFATPEDDIDWADMNPAIVSSSGPGLAAGGRPVRYRARRWRRRAAKITPDRRRVTRLVEAARLNVAVARLMELAAHLPGHRRRPGRWRPGRAGGRGDQAVLL
jgi:hypothetical protein